MTFEAILSQKQKIEAIRQLMDGLTPKQVAWNFDVAPHVIYELRSTCLRETWVLKKHPKEKFKLE